MSKDIQDKQVLKEKYIINKLKKVLPVKCSMNFNLDVSELWRLISAPGNLNDSHPFCSKNEVIVWDETNHIDKLLYLNGRLYIRKFKTWEENKGYTLLIGEESGPQSYVIWEIDKIAENKSNLTITVHPFILAKLSQLSSYVPYYLFVKPRMTTYLNSVLGGFKYFCDNKKKVPRNYFGSHRWFS